MFISVGIASCWYFELGNFFCLRFPENERNTNEQKKRPSRAVIAVVLPSDMALNTKNGRLEEDRTFCGGQGRVKAIDFWSCQALLGGT